MKKILFTFSLFAGCYLLFTIFISSPAQAADDPPPGGEPPPGDVIITPPPCASCDGEEEERTECYSGVPESWCCQKGEENNEGVCPKDEQGRRRRTWGRGEIYLWRCNCEGWYKVGKLRDECTSACTPAKADIEPYHYSLEESIGDFNEYTEGECHSGTRDVGGIDPSDPNCYGAAIALVPAGGPNHELRVGFIRDYGGYKVTFEDGSQQTARAIWDECTSGGDLNNWRLYQDQLKSCSKWGFVPTTLRRLETTPTPIVKTKKEYYQEQESPLILTWSNLWNRILEWISSLFTNAICSWTGWFCPNSSLPLRNPDDAPGWRQGKPNIPLEARANAQLLRQFLLPPIPPGPLPPGRETYFDISDPKTAEIMSQTGEATQLAAAEGGLFRIFQPLGITPNSDTDPSSAFPTLCREDRLNPEEKCASAFYYKLNVNGGVINECQGRGCYSDTPDQDTFAAPRLNFTDDRALMERAWGSLYKSGLWPIGVSRNSGIPPGVPPGTAPPPGTGGAGTLDFLISYMDQNVRVIDPDGIKAYVRRNWGSSRVYELWDTVVAKSIEWEVNPAFALTIWIEESGASASEAKANAKSAFGCFPGGDTNQVVSFDRSLDCFLYFTAVEHPSDFEDWVRYFCGPRADPICSNNPGFIGRMKEWYSRLVPSGNYGAIIPAT